jgi:plastocyanin
MTEKPFGVKQLNIIGATGTPTIESAGDLNIGGNQVAITTNTTVSGVVTATAFVGNGAGLTNLPGGGSYGNSDVDTHLNQSNPTSGYVLSWNGSDYAWVADQSGSVPANLTATTLDVSGICTAGSFVTDLISGDGTSRGFATRYYVTSSGSSDYRFAGPGQRDTVGNPTIYLMRGFTYIFENSTGNSHPFRIQYQSTTTGVGTYVSGAQNATQVFTIPHDAPGAYEYQCTAHSGMKGTFIIPS